VHRVREVQREVQGYIRGQGVVIHHLRHACLRMDHQGSWGKRTRPQEAEAADQTGGVLPAGTGSAGCRIHGGAGASESAP
jgi:hypothetical protein